MPTRLLREGILSSDRVNDLDFPAEVFYRRLMSRVDDHGLYDARLSVLRSSLYPLKVDRVREADISRWMATCQKAGLIVLYEAGGKPYLQMLDTKWERRGQPKYPIPNNSQLKTDVNGCKPPGTDSPVVVVEGVCVFEGGTMSRPNGHDLMQQAGEILEYLNRATSKGFELKSRSGKPTANADIIVARLKEGYTPVELKEVVLAKCEQWAGDENMSEFLRPETLFGRTKFQQYLGEIKGG